MIVLAVLMFCRSGVGQEPLKLDAALGHISTDARALVLVNSRLQELIAPELTAYVKAAQARRKFEIALLPIVGLDDCSPPEVRQAIQGWHKERPKVEGILFVGNVKIPSFFMPRGDTLSVRLWSKYYEDMDMAPATRDADGLVAEFRSQGVQGARAQLRPDAPPLHQPGAMGGLPARRLPGRRREYLQNWAEQLAPFFKKTAAFYDGSTTYGRGMYLLSNDASLLVRAKPVWDAIGPKEIEFYSINEKGKDAYKNNPAGYVRVNLEKFATLQAFMNYNAKLFWMDEGWQSPKIFPPAHEPIAAADRVVERPFQS